MALFACVLPGHSRVVLWIFPEAHLPWPSGCSFHWVSRLGSSQSSTCFQAHLGDSAFPDYSAQSQREERPSTATGIDHTHSQQAKPLFWLSCFQKHFQVTSSRSCSYGKFKELLHPFIQINNFKNNQRHSERSCTL